MRNRDCVCSGSTCFNHIIIMVKNIHECDHECMYAIFMHVCRECVCMYACAFIRLWRTSRVMCHVCHARNIIRVSGFQSYDFLEECSQETSIKWCLHWVCLEHRQGREACAEACRLTTRNGKPITMGRSQTDNKESSPEDVGAGFRRCEVQKTAISRF